MSDHLRFAGAGALAQRAEIARIVRSSPMLMAVLEAMRAEALPQGLLVAGAIYNLVWNRLTGRPDLTGVNDIDVVYFDDSDLSYEAEDVVIRRFGARLAQLPLPLQLRNQARVHLWFERKFGMAFTPLTCGDEMLGRYASKTHAVGVRLNAEDGLDIVAPFGLDDLFAFRMVPNPALPNRAAHEAKGARAKSIWPELTIVPWEDAV